MYSKLRRKSVLIAFNVFLSIGCFWQIFNVCDLYFKYPTNIFIDTKFEPLSKPVPALTLVANIGDHSFLNSTEVMETFEHRQFKKEMFKSIIIKGPNGEQHSLLEEYLDTAIERISLNYYSITLNSVLTAKNQTTMLKWNEEIEIIIVAYGVHNVWWLYLHNSYDMPFSNDWNALEIRHDTKYRVTWKLDAFQLLESPYGTDCKVYRTSSPYLSRKDCIRNCKRRVSIEKCGFIWDGIDLLRDEKSVRFGDSNNKSCIKVIDFDSICSKECIHFDCNIDYYEPIRTNMYSGEWYGTICLNIPTKPETAHFHAPRIQTIEFICYLASTFSMWFGLSFYSGFYLLNIFRNKLFKHAQKKLIFRKTDRGSFNFKKQPLSEIRTMNWLTNIERKPFSDNYRF